VWLKKRTDWDVDLMDTPRNIGLWFSVVNGVVNNWNPQTGQRTTLLNRTE